VRWVGIVVGLAIVVAPCVAAPVPMRDVTTAVAAETRLDELVAQLCRDYCQGNRRQGRLRRVTVGKLDPDRFVVRVDVALRNVQDSPLGGGFVLYDYTLAATGEGTLRKSDCTLRVDRVVVHDDPLGLQSLARSEVGKTHVVDGCRRFSFLR
jgi:hypothetical protein